MGRNHTALRNGSVEAGSGNPDVWLRRWWTVTSTDPSANVVAGTSGKKPATRSESFSFPSSAKARTAAAVNPLETEPMQNTVSGVFWAFVERLASP